MSRFLCLPFAASLALCSGITATSAAEQAGAEIGSATAGYDEALARSLGADDNGMRSYVLVILRSSATPVPEGPERNEMFRSHFANMKRLSDEGKLALAGPLDGVDGWRGLFVLAVADIGEAKRLVATDPVIEKGEMVAEYHTYYGSAALMMIRDLHEKIAKKDI